MNLNGIWKADLLTMYDWEPRATVFFKDGVYWSASAQHYAAGTYTVDNGKFSAEISIVSYGQSRVLFGKKGGTIDITIEAEADENQFTGTATDNSGAHLVQYRYTKLADLPST